MYQDEVYHYASPTSPSLRKLICTRLVRRIHTKEWVRLKCFFDGCVNPFCTHIFAEEGSSLHASNDDGQAFGVDGTSTLAKRIRCKDS